MWWFEILGKFYSVIKVRHDCMRHGFAVQKTESYFTWNEISNNFGSGWREKSKKKKDIESEFGILPNSLSTVLKNRDAILKQFDSSSPSRKRHRSGAHTQVEEALFKWFQEKRAQNVPLSGPVLMTKAEDFAKRLGDISFNPNTGWLERFKTRHSIVSRSISGESAEVNADLENNWLTTKLPTLIKNYEPRDINNADETG